MLPGENAPGRATPLFSEPPEDVRKGGEKNQGEMQISSMRKLVKGNESSGLPSYLLCNRKTPSPGCALADLMASADPLYVSG